MKMNLISLFTLFAVGRDLIIKNTTLNVYMLYPNGTDTIHGSAASVLILPNTALHLVAVTATNWEEY